MTNSEDSTVMGPGGSNSPGDMLIAPAFNHKVDKFQYRRDVRSWYDFVLTSASSGHNRAKGIASGLARCLCARLAPRYKQKTDAAVDSGRLKFRKPDGSQLSQEEQVRLVEDILALVAKDSTTDRVRRLVEMSKKVYQCRRKKGETFPDYAARFQGVADAYLSYANANTNGQDEQNFVMILLENANLDNTTYNNIIKEVVTDARNNTIDPSIQVTTKSLRKFQEIVRDSQNTLNAIGTPSSSQDGSCTSHHVELRKIGELKDSNELMTSLLASLNIPANDDGLQERLQFTMTLDRAIIALQDIRIDEKETREETTETKTDTATEQTKIKTDKTKKLGTMMGSAKPSDEKNRNRYFAQKRRNGKQNYKHRDYKRQRTYGSVRRYNQYSDGDTEDDRDSSDEDARGSRKRRHVTKRLGRRYDTNEDTGKRVRFDDEETTWKSNKKYNRYSKSDDESDGDPYFRKQVHPSSRRT